jgi:epoxyqueuosine reductase
MSDTSLDRSALVQSGLARLEVDALGVALVADLAEPRLRDQVLALLPQARSVVAMAMEVYSEILDHSRPGKQMGEASPGDMLAPHMDYMNSRLTKAAYDVAKLCHRQGFKALPMPAANYPTDVRYLTSVLSYKHAAEAAGLGTIGRHSLLVTPEFGPRVRLACVLVEAELRPTPNLAGDLCDGCNSCIKNCPMGALMEPENGEAYRINKYACNAFRSGSGSCAECMRVCTQGR